MTPDQITQLLQILTQAPTQVILAFALYIVYKDAVRMISAGLSWGAAIIQQSIEAAQLVASDARRNGQPADRRAP